jgi:sec-independent protein translocase protein TatA
MGLPNIGPLELIIILAIALLIVGPGRLPEMGNAIGRTIREFRSASSDISDATKLDQPASSTPPPAQPQPNQLSDTAEPNTPAEQPAPTSKPAAVEPKSDGKADA